KPRVAASSPSAPSRLANTVGWMGRTCSAVHAPAAATRTAWTAPTTVSLSQANAPNDTRNDRTPMISCAARAGSRPNHGRSAVVRERGMGVYLLPWGPVRRGAVRRCAGAAFGSILPGRGRGGRFRPLRRPLVRVGLRRRLQVQAGRGEVAEDR